MPKGHFSSVKEYCANVCGIVNAKFKYLSVMSNLAFVQRMVKLEKEMKSDMTGAKRDSTTEIFPEQPLTKGESQKQAALCRYWLPHEGNYYTGLSPFA